MYKGACTYPTPFRHRYIQIPDFVAIFLMIKAPTGNMDLFSQVHNSMLYEQYSLGLIRTSWLQLHMMLNGIPHLLWCLWTFLYRTTYQRCIHKGIWRGKAKPKMWYFAFILDQYVFVCSFCVTREDGIYRKEKRKHSKGERRIRALG